MLTCSQLAAVAGLTGAEIADVLGRTHAAVKIAQVRAYQTLRRYLQQSGALDAKEGIPRGSK